MTSNKIAHLHHLDSGNLDPHPCQAAYWFYQDRHIGQDSKSDVNSPLKLNKLVMINSKESNKATV